MTKRLLTDEELKLGMSDIKNLWLHSTGRKTVFEKDCFDSIINLNRFAQDAKTHKETLKEVGEWLEDEYLIVDPITHEPKGYWVDLADGNNLKCGEMPEGAK